MAEEFNYARSQRTAQRLIRKFGLLATLIQQGPKGGTANNPTPGQITRTPIRGVLEKVQSKDADGTLIDEWTKTLMIDGLGPRPSKKDKVEIGGYTYTVGTVVTEEPGGLPVTHTMTLEG